MWLAGLKESVLNKRPTVRVVTATEAKNRFGAIIKSAYLQEEHLIVQRGGIPVAAIIPMQDYERLIAGVDVPAEVAEAVGSSSKAANARAHLRSFLAEAHCQIPEVPEDEVNKDIQAAIAEVRSGA
jgi:prevent-host-death family protein